MYPTSAVVRVYLKTIYTDTGYRFENQRLTLNSDAMEHRLSDYKDQLQELKAELKESKEDNKKLQQDLLDIVRKRDDI